MGENLLFGGGSIGPSKATEEWYNSEGHRANMLGDYQSVGIACVRDVRGNTYWVQNFTTAAATPESTPSSGTERYFFSVEVAEAYMNVQVIQTPQSMETGEKALVYVTNGEAPVVPTIIETSDESVVSLSMENGGVCISAVGAGTATLTLGFGGHSTHRDCDREAGRPAGGDQPGEACGRLQREGGGHHLHHGQLPAQRRA